MKALFSGQPFPGSEESYSSKIFKNFDTVLIALILILLAICFFHQLMEFSALATTINDFSTIFLSIVLEALPFILLGSLLASLIAVFVSEDIIARVIPKSRISGVILASFLGLVFPLCECAIIPIVRRLVVKGMPLYIAVTLMVAVPIINPITLLSTYYAFSNYEEMVIIRAVYAWISAIAIGYLMSFIPIKEQPLKESEEQEQHFCSMPAEKAGTLATINHIFTHMNNDFFDIGRYLIIGSFLAACIQTFVPAGFIASIGQGPAASVIVLMVLSFLLSLCSSADAFVGRTFSGQFSDGAVVAFLLLGAMIDLKNTMLLMGTFKFRYVIRIIVLIFIVCFIMGLKINLSGI